MYDVKVVYFKFMYTYNVFGGTLSTKHIIGIHKFKIYYFYVVHCIENKFWCWLS